jgi:Holliday junction DNA helicase RuvA
MIGSLRGTLIEKAPTEVLVEVNGIGFAVHIPLSTYEALPAAGATVTLQTHLHVREDALQLYGFGSALERTMFRMLIDVTGIGPRMAQSILSGISVADLRAYLASGNHAALTAIPGIGKKLAERLALELRDKVTRMEAAAELPGSVTDAHAQMRAEALLALTSLGYPRPVAEKALRGALHELNGSDTTVEALLKAALRHAAR